MGEAEVLAILRKYGPTITVESLRAALPELNAAGIYVQNQARGDLRPRILLPNKHTVDLGDFNGPWQWVYRGDYGDWHAGQGGDTPVTPAPPSNPGQPGILPGEEGPAPPGSGWNGIPAEGIPAGTNPMEFFLRSTPGYKFAFDEGQRAVQTSAASKGTLLTGGTLKALARFGTGLADQTYDQATRRYLSLADLGARTATAPF